MDQRRALAILSGEDRSLSAGATRVLAAGAEPFYRAGMAVRNAFYQRGIFKSVRLSRPVISVGNITTGGTGKTPMVAEIARRLASFGAMPGVLMRGYKSSASAASDEATLLARELAGIAGVEPGADRAAAAVRLLARQPHVSVFILDDGFQHRRVKRDLDLVLVDATRPDGFGRVLPRGLLRESACNLRRAHAVIVTRADLATPTQLAEVDAWVARHAGAPPIAHSATLWDSMLDHADQWHDTGALAGMKVAGVCGIGNPSAFWRMLEAAGAQVVWRRELGDHEGFADASSLHLAMKEAEAAGAELCVTTEKDWVKWGLWLGDCLPVWRPVLRLRFIDGENALDEKLRAVAG